MTRRQTLSKNPLLVLLTALLAAAAIAFAAADRADAAPGAVGNVTATCYSDGYIVVNDGGNVASAPKHLQLQIAHRNAQGGWTWKKYAWRSISGKSFRLNATKGAQFYIYATIATANGSGGFTYEKDWVSVTNVKISPIGAVTGSTKTRGLCQT
jgi:hypothetical protein